LRITAVTALAFTSMDIILLPGLWLPHTIWTDVATELRRMDHHPVAVSLPGVDDRSTDTALDDQLAAVLSAVDGCDRPLVVGHSAASTLAWLAADRRPGALTGVVLVGGFPTTNGSIYADFFPVTDGVMQFPGWEPFEGPDSDDLDDDAKARIESVVVPVPHGVACAAVEYFDDRRFNVPVILVCPEYSPDQAREWIASGDLPELTRVRDVSFVDIDSGHWPMISQPIALAGILGLSAETLDP
jgi:pimeloyl-ACP methyl ester carboxylesterase